MNPVSFLESFGVQVVVKSDGNLTIKGLSGLSGDDKREVLSFARDNKKGIVSELEAHLHDTSKIQPERFMTWQERSQSNHPRGNVMGWRDRAKKDSAYSAYIAEGTQNLRTSKKERKEGLKGTFKDLTHNTQITQNRNLAGGRQKEETNLSTNSKPLTHNTQNTQIKSAESESTTCPVCNGTAWWRENSPGSEWHCYWCNPGVPLDSADYILENRGAKSRGTMFLLAGRLWPVPKNRMGLSECPACGQCQWWRKNEPGAKWICGVCHPPAAGLDVIFRDE